MMQITIDGLLINNLSDFYDQIEKHLIVGECPWGRNLDSLDEIVMYRFNYTDDTSSNVTEILWSNSIESAQKLNQGERQNLFEILVETLSGNSEMKLTLA
ncbi:barstar family protein [Hymenobacter terricola]|uniref:barstar family protein n=1 Tax=Hymenobacter terricola TaxID=2819236 RepID=UPI001B3069C8|nr:barstar family protein [Hymenobacter terricola]